MSFELVTIIGLVFSLVQFVRSTCAEPPATKTTVIEAVRQELQRSDSACAMAATQGADSTARWQAAEPDDDAVRAMKER